MLSTIPTTFTAFEAGYRDGRRTGRFTSAAEVIDDHPDWPARLIEIYLNGRDDGVIGDDFRLRGARP